MTDEDAHGFLLALLKSFVEESRPFGGSQTVLIRSTLLANLAEAFPGVNWEERMLHAEAIFIRAESGPALPDWLR